MYLWLSLKPQTTALALRQLARSLRMVAAERTSSAQATTAPRHSAAPASSPKTAAK